MKEKGFTLIELLVVIAIISLLATVVLASLNSVRSKARDASIKSNLSSMRGQAEIYYDIPGNYGVPFDLGPCAATAGTLFEDARIQNFLESAGNSSIANGGVSRGTCASTANAWAVSVPLYSDPNESWCVDNQGSSLQITGDITTTNCD